MIRIETSVSRHEVIFAVIGRIESNDLPELKKVIESHDCPVILDLKGVRLVDRDGVTFLANFETDNGRITNCPPYIREWIRRERAEGMN
jgi:ABC-type transporter Mla MlaB component